MFEGRHSVHYDIVLAGFRLNAAEPPAKVLERVLGIAPDQAKALTRQFPSVVLSRADQATAQSVVQQLRQAGAQVEIREDASAEAAQANVSAPPARPASSAGMQPVAPPAAPRPHAATMLGAGLAVPVPPQRASSAGLAPVPVSSAPANSNAAAESAGSSYQLGDIAIASSDAIKAPAPAAASASAAAPASAASLDPLDAPDPGGSLELASAPQPVKGGTKPAADSASFGGMQTFGDGLDDFQGNSPSLELDTNADWRKKPGAGVPEGARAQPAAKPPAAKPAAPEVDLIALASSHRVSMPGTVPARITPVTRPLKERLKELAQDVFEWSVAALAKLVALAIVSAISAAAVGYARSPEAAYELVGLERYPDELPKIAHGATATSVVDALIALHARTHPVLRMAPDALRPSVADWYRAQIPGVYPVAVELPKDAVSARCVVVDTSPEPRDRSVRERLLMLVHTGEVLKPGPTVELELARQVSALRGRLGAQRNLTPVCLAL